MTRIDSHIHLLPEDFRAALEQRGLMPPLPPWSMEIMDGFLRRFAIDAAVLSLAPPGVFFGDAGLARELARMVNERIASIVRAEPDRFAGLAVVPLPDVEGAIAEVAYALDELGLDGVVLLSNVGGTYPGDPAWDPFFDELERRGAYVFLHPNMPPHPLPLDHPVWLYEFVFDTTRALTSLIYSGTLERCPSVRMQVAHLGGTAPFLAHRLASLADREPQLAERAPAGALAYLSRLYYDTGLTNNGVALASTREVVDLSRVVFGSDWPYTALPDSGDDPAPGLDVLGAGERAAVDGRNIGALVPRLVGS